MSNKNWRAYELSLPVYPLSKHLIYPHTYWLIDSDEKSNRTTLLEKILKNDPPQCVVIVKNDSDKIAEPASFSKIGVISSVKIVKERFRISAEHRASVDNLAYYPGQNIWRADVTKLVDVPGLAELTDNHYDLPMIFGAVESIYRLLLDLKPLVEENELAKKIEENISNLRLAKRDKDIAYTLPWHILIDFAYMPEEIKARMLATDNVIERLQTIIDVLKMEIKIMKYSKDLAEDEPANDFDKTKGK